MIHFLTFMYVLGEIDKNGVDSTVGEDSDSLGNPKTTSKSSIAPPAKEKRKPFFKKVR